MEITSINHQSKIGPVTHYSADCLALASDIAEGYGPCESDGWLCTECVEVPTTPLWQNPSVNPADYATPALPEGSGSGSGGSGRGAAPKAKSVTLTDEEAEALTAELAKRADRKFVPEEVTPELAALADRYARAYEGTFQFMFDMREAAVVRGLTVGQAKGVLNCLLAELRRNAAAAPAAPAEGGSLDLSGLPAGMYAVPGGDTRLKVRVSVPGERSKWNGWIFVNDGAEYGAGTKYGSQRPGELYRGQIVEQLRAIVADPRAAAAAYGQLTGKCGLCGRQLEDEESVARGIGPICAEKL